MGKKAAKTTKTAAKKAASKKPTTKKSAAKSPAAPAKASAKTTKKTAPKKAAPKAPTATAAKAVSAKKAAPKNTTSKPAPPKAASDSASAKKSPVKKVAKTPAPKAEAPESKASAKTGRKGITIVTPKPAAKPKPAPVRAAVPALTGSILGMGLGSGKPLIPSGPKAPPIGSTELAQADGSGKKPKSPFNKKQLDKYREVLLQKRRELLGDIDSMENEALKSQSGSLSHLPQHMAEQGSETYEQSLSLDLAAADRVLLREIEAALKRIADRTYGLCERTGKPITKERLAELPWARYSIEAAREMERRTTGP